MKLGSQKPSTESFGVLKTLSRNPKHFCDKRNTPLADKIHSCTRVQWAFSETIGHTVSV